MWIWWSFFRFYSKLEVNTLSSFKGKKKFHLPYVKVWLTSWVNLNSKKLYKSRHNNHSLFQNKIKNYLFIIQILWITHICLQKPFRIQFEFKIRETSWISYTQKNANLKFLIQLQHVLSVVPLKFAPMCHHKNYSFEFPPEIQHLVFHVSSSEQKQNVKIKSILPPEKK